jgi:hypothetical protein
VTALLLATTAGLAAFHTVIGVDHYLPFVALGRARRWSLRTTLGVTALCGAGHVGASVVLGLGAIALGLAMEELAWIDGTRGDAASWLLVGFGVAYAAWSLWRLLRKRTHRHAYVGADGTTHEHDHDGGHAHVHSERIGALAATSTWALFIVFVLGPCETLVPLMTAPAIEHAWSTVALVVGVFGAATIGAMLLMVALLHAGLSTFRLRWGRYAHVGAGLAVAASGLAVMAFGI